MIEVSFLELALLCYGIIATGLAFKFHDEAKNHQHMMHVVMEEPEVREEMIKQYKEWKANQNAN